MKNMLSQQQVNIPIILWEIASKKTIERMGINALGSWEIVDSSKNYDEFVKKEFLNKYRWKKDHVFLYKISESKYESIYFHKATNDGDVVFSISSGKQIRDGLCATIFAVKKCRNIVFVKYTEVGEKFMRRSDAELITIKDVGVVYATKEYIKNRLYQCKKCNKYVVQRSDLNGYEKCTSCLCEEGYKKCEKCREWNLAEDMHTNDGSFYCDDCFDSLPRCNHCGNIFHQKSCYIEICDDCFNMAWHDYSYKPTPIFHSCPTRQKDKSSMLYMGVELEVDRYNDEYIRQDEDSVSTNYRELIFEIWKQNEGKVFYMKPDGSINYGFEIVSHPCTLDFHKEEAQWEDIMKNCTNNGFLSHDVDTCGLHVHVPKKLFSKIDKIKLGYFCNAKKRLMEFIGKRGSGEYTRFVKKKELHDYGANYQRYEAINFKNSATIEFRFMKGTLNYKTFIARLEFIDACCKWVKNISIASMLKGTAEKAFLEFVSNNKKSYPGFDEYLENNGVYRHYSV